MLKWIISALAVFCLTACTGIPDRDGKIPSRDGTIPWVSLEHECLGLCVGPGYTVTLFADGTVVFEGRYNVKEKGVRVKHLDPQKIAPIFAKIDEVNFWQTDSSGREKHQEGNETSEVIRLMPFDSPCDTITARDDKKHNRVEGVNFLSRNMINLATLIDQTAGVSDWVGTWADWRAEWRREHGS